MAENSSIEWTNHTFNPWVGCAKVSPACDHCYAEGWAKRAGTPELWQGQRRRTSAANWRQPLKWDRAAQAAGKRARVFCASLADVFDNHPAITDDWRQDLGALIRATPHLDWLLLSMTAIVIDLEALLKARRVAKEVASREEEAAKSGTDEKERNYYMPAYCDPNNEFRGTKYDATRDLPLTEVCKRIRQDIKDAIAGGLLPKVKVSVRKQDYRAVSLIVKEVPEAFQFYNLKYLKWAREYPFEDKHGYGPDYPGWCDPRSEQYRQVIDALTEIVQAYNRDNSDSMVDYFDVRFYTTVDFCGDLMAGRKEEEMAALPA